MEGRRQGVLRGGLRAATVLVDVASGTALCLAAALCAYAAADAVEVNASAALVAYAAPGEDYEQLLASVREAAPDLVGFIALEETGIVQPIVQGQDNTYYLTHRYDGASSFGGSAFLDYRANTSFSCGVPLVYGHNMEYSCMFGDVARYAKEAGYLQQHASGVLWVAQESTWHHLEVLCVVACTENDRALYDALDDEDKEAFAEAANNQALASLDEVRAEMPLIALSTCADASGLARYLLVCRICD